ncbi:MAG: response regulator [Proteobacteria bacterium]|nr:response regulator [Pseudomonadota bacterium]MBU1386683.1 response regulator [Pseudomonadota bacterium]MBU1543294.1 response regulator [Pseudomonadota bacterium]MBU2431486.1 response regulator [Pseudomonadota bacterium]MBU2483125.1 response regulator [Pseudomonadota bacterium]
MEDINLDMPILIVDDSASMRRIVMKFLENAGFNRFVEAEDGNEALAVVKKQKIDLIISDLNMPDMDGMEFLRIVKADAQFKDIPFVMLTVEAIQKTMNTALSMGVDSYIVKPITENLFVNELKRVIYSKNKQGIE